MNYKIVAKRMLQIKKEKEITFTHIEQVTGLRNARILHLLGGRSAPRLSEFALLCISLGASADELLKADDKWEIVER